ncbi:hypothetical protein HDU76_008613 [Blyttiomyces sp. JEL0837]|nr:hypothetical protein HDU76_008613 [Blyttiomyces sp. JEL0837]
MDYGVASFVPSQMWPFSSYPGVTIAKTWQRRNFLLELYILNKKGINLSNAKIDDLLELRREYLFKFSSCDLLEDKVMSLFGSNHTSIYPVINATRNEDQDFGDLPIFPPSVAPVQNSKSPSNIKVYPEFQEAESQEARDDYISGYIRQCSVTAKYQITTSAYVNEKELPWAEKGYSEKLSYRLDQILYGIDLKLDLFPDPELENAYAKWHYPYFVAIYRVAVILICLSNTIHGFLDVIT